MLSRTKKVRTIRNSVTLKFGKLTHSSKNKVNTFSLPYIRQYFEELYSIFTEKQLDSSKGQYLLDIVADIQNECSLDEEEFIYLFNDPLYAKQTASEEKKQKEIMKLINQRAQEIRQEKIVTHNKELNQLLAFHEPGENAVKERSKEKPAKARHSETKITKKSAAVKIQSEEIEPPIQDSERKQELDTFDIEERGTKKKTTKKTIKKAKTKKDERDSTKKEVVSNKEKEKQKSLLDFGDDKKDSRDKKKKGSKNLLEFM